jgi:membrane protein
VFAKLGRVLPEALQRYFLDRCPQHAAAISYRVLFSIAPLAIVLVSIFGLVLQDESVRSDVVKTIVDALPVSVAGRKDVEDAITEIATPASAAGLISLVVFAWAATGMMAAVRTGLETAMGVTVRRPMARGKLVDLILIVGAAVLVIATAGMAALGEFIQRGAGGSAVAGAFLRLATFLVSIGVILLVYRFVPARGLHFRDGLAGAVVTALLLQAIAFASALIYEKTTSLSIVYGSLTAALVFLYSIFLYAAALLYGAEVAAAWARPPGPPGPPVLTQIKRGVLGLFVSQPQDPPGASKTDISSDR